MLRSFPALQPCTMRPHPLISLTSSTPQPPIPLHFSPHSTENHILLCPPKSELASPLIPLIPYQEGQVQYLHG